MQPFRTLLTILFALAAIIWLVATANAAGPRNPYSSFNLSGINYGAQQWERAQRQGRVVWPYYNVPSRGSTRPSGVYVGGVIAGGSGAGTIIQAGSSRPAPRSYTTRPSRRWRR
ncbi:MAG: hypothetical protein EBS56_09985 [Planctomycetia bacterium]|nr:hypothetical protein [Planctomycetia bacterium]